MVEVAPSFFIAQCNNELQVLGFGNNARLSGLVLPENCGIQGPAGFAAIVSAVVNSVSGGGETKLYGPMTAEEAGRFLARRMARLTLPSVTELASSEIGQPVIGAYIEEAGVLQYELEHGSISGFGDQVEADLQNLSSH